MKNAPAKPKRRFLPLSLSFDDGEERRRRFQQKLKNKEANERELLHPSTKEYFCGTYASVTLNNRKVEIPYIDADPLKLPHAITLSNALKSGVRGARNNSSRPKSMIDNCEELHGVEFTCINDNPLKKDNFTMNISPTVISYAEWKKKFDPKNRSRIEVISTPKNLPNEARDTNAEKLQRKKTLTQEAHERSPDSPIQRLKKKVSRSKSTQPPNVARKRLNDDTKWRMIVHTEENATEGRKKFHRCNSESSEALIPSESANPEKEFRIRAKLLKSPEHDSQCSNSPGGSTERAHKNSWLSSAGKIKSAFSRTKKQQQSSDNKCDAKVFSNSDTSNQSKAKTHLLSAEKEATDAAVQNMTISTQANAETNTSVASTGDQQLQGKNIFNECLTIHQNGTNPGLQRSESSNKSTQLTPLSTGGRQSQANIFDEFETIQPRRPLSEASCYDSNERVRGRLFEQRSASTASIAEIGTADAHRAAIDATTRRRQSNTKMVAEIAKIFSK